MTETKANGPEAPTGAPTAQVWRRLWRWRVLVVALALAVVAVVFRIRIPSAQAFRGVVWWAVALLALLALLTVVLNGLKLKVMYRGFHVDLGASEAVALSAVNALGNLMPLQAGVWARGVYLNLRHRLSGPAFLASVVSIVGLNLLVAAGCSLVLSFTLNAAGGVAGKLQLASAGVLLIVLCGLGCARIALRLESLPQALRTGLEGVGTFGHSGFDMIALLLLCVAEIATWAGRLFVALNQFGNVDPSSLPALGLIASLTIISGLVAATPGNIGVREAVITAASAALVVPSEVGLAASLLDRAVSVCVILLAGMGAQGFLIYAGRRRRSVASEIQGGR